MKLVYAIAAGIFLLASFTATIANGQTTLPGVNVVANPCSLPATCVYASGFDTFLIPPPPAFPPYVASIDPSVESLVATCKSLRDQARRLGCNLDDTPPAPGFPSPTQGAWVSNGCGDGSITTNILIGLLGSEIDGYTGDPTNPLPGVSFKSPCAGHDQCYHMSSSKTVCDNVFAHALDNACHEHASDTVFAQCLAFAGAYATAVKQHGQDPYNDDQRIMKCAKINSDLDHGNCVS